MEKQTEEIACQQFQELLPLLWTRELEGHQLNSAEKHRRMCPTCREAASIEEDLNLLIRQAYTEMPDYAADAAESVRQRVRPELITSRFNWRSIFSLPNFQMVTATVAVLLIATISLLFWNNRSASLFAASHRDHIRCVRNHEHDDWLKAPAEVSVFLQKHLGVSAVPFDYEALGLRLMRARICNLGGPRFVHIVFQDASQNEISLYLRQSPQSLLSGQGQFETAGDRVYVEQIEEFQIAAFEIKQRTFVLLSSLPGATTSRLAASLIQQL